MCPLRYCVASNLRTSTYALNNATLPFVLQIADKGWRKALTDDEHLRRGLNVAFGKVTFPEVAEALGYTYEDARAIVAG